MLTVEDLRVSFAYGGRPVEVVHGVDLSVGVGESVGIVGESGSGKSVTGRAIMGILPTPPARTTAKRMEIAGQDLRGGGVPEAGDGHQGQPIAMIFQNPFTALNPVFRVGSTLTEALVKRRGMSRSDATAEAVRLLDRVRIPNAKSRIRNYPHEFSGGMQQRIVIALALALEPRLLIADEPTTALDVTVQAEILELLREIQTERTMGMIFISHALGVVAEVVSRVNVMYAGRIVESGPVGSVYDDPKHPYTQALLLAAPKVGQFRTRTFGIPGSPPDPSSPPPGCAFHPRCALATDVCRDTVPDVRPRLAGGSGTASCHHAGESLVAEGATR
ncbi:MAG: ATP-binding cassette domain-containing protein [Propionibacteriales bacterium]|nr:ATP-binding cassette domain-containing protein [Propionibacteriales bacterium]